MTTENVNYILSDTLLADLERLKGASGTNKNGQAINLITACIMNGVDTFAGIVDALKRLGLKYEHIVIILRKEGGRDPLRHLWYLDLDTRFKLHEAHS